MSSTRKFFLSDSVTDIKEFEADVLYQKICGKWYAFSVVDDDCLMAEVPEAEVQKIMATKNGQLKAA